MPERKETRSTYRGQGHIHGSYSHGTSASVSNTVSASCYEVGQQFPRLPVDAVPKAERRYFVAAQAALLPSELRVHPDTRVPVLLPRPLYYSCVLLRPTLPSWSCIQVGLPDAKMQHRARAFHKSNPRCLIAGTCQSRQGPVRIAQAAVC